MPVYEYACGKCGQIKEVVQKISDPPLTRCEVCNGKVRKLISQSSFHLKGTGWYVTDYASKSNTGKNANHQKAESSEKGKEAEDSGKIAQKKADE